MVAQRPPVCHHPKNPYQEECFEGGVKLVSAKYCAAIFNWLLSPNYSRTAARLLFAKLALSASAKKISTEEIRTLANIPSYTLPTLERALTDVTAALMRGAQKTELRNPERKVQLPVAVLKEMAAGMRKESMLVCLWGCVMMRDFRNYTFVVCQAAMARRWKLANGTQVTRAVSELESRGVLGRAFVPLKELEKWGIRHYFECCARRCELVKYDPQWRRKNPPGSNAWRAWAKREERLRREIEQGTWRPMEGRSVEPQKWRRRAAVKEGEAEGRVGEENARRASGEALVG